MLDLVRSAPTPDNPSSHLGVDDPGLRPGDVPDVLRHPQTVEVNAKRSLGDGHAQAGRSRVPDRLLRHDRRVQRRLALRQVGRRLPPHARVGRRLQGRRQGQGVVRGGRQELDPFTFTSSALGHGNRVLVLSAEDYTGLSPNAAPFAGPAYLSTYTDALADAGIPADVYDIDAQGRTQADLLGVLSHYKAVVWYTGAGRLRPRSRARHRRHEDVRRPDGLDPRLHQRGRQGPRHRPARAVGRVVAVLLQPARALAGQAAVHVQHGRGRDRASSRTA